MKSWEKHQEDTFKVHSTEASMNDPIERNRFTFLTESIKEGNRVLDIGANHGHLADEIRKKGNSVFAFDLPEVVRKGIRKHPKLNWKAGSAEEKLPYADNFFDVVIASEIIEHLLELNNFLDEVHRILKPEGRLLVTTPNVARPVNAIQLLVGHVARGFFHDQEKPMHIRFYTPLTLVNTLKQHDFKIIRLGGAKTGNDWYKEDCFTAEEVRVLRQLIWRFRPDKVGLYSIIFVEAKKYKKNKKGKKFALIVGKPRTGTSVTGDLIQSLGFNFGKESEVLKEKGLREGRHESIYTGGGKYLYVNNIPCEDIFEKEGITTLKVANNIQDWISILDKRFDLRIINTTRDDRTHKQSSEEANTRQTEDIVHYNRIIEDMKSKHKTFIMKFEKTVEKDEAQLKELMKFLGVKGDINKLKELIHPEIVKYK